MPEEKCSSSSISVEVLDDVAGAGDRVEVVAAGGQPLEQCLEAGLIVAGQAAEDVRLQAVEAAAELLERGAAVVGGDDGARAAVGRVGPALEQAGLFHVVEQVGHDRAVDAEALGDELAQVRELVRQVASGAVAVGQARSEINRMTMRQNKWMAGAYCASYCRLVTL